MSADPRNLLAFCKSISETSDEELSRLDPEGLKAMTAALRDLKKEVDRTLLRLSFVADDRSLN